MLNKRIKSVLVAGLVVLGMGFAKVDSYAAETLKSEITDIDFVKGEEQKVIELQQGYIVVTINRDADGIYDVIVEYDKTVLNVVGIDSLFEVGNLYSDFNTCYDVEYKENKVIVTIKDVNSVPEGFNPVGELVGVNVHFVLVDSDNDGVADFKDDTPKPEEPEKPKDPNVKDPETGDASMIAMVGIAIASAAGLVLTRRKDDEE